MLVFYSFSTVEKNINIYFLSLSIWSKKTTFPTFDPRTAYASFFLVSNKKDIDKNHSKTCYNIRNRNLISKLGNSSLFRRSKTSNDYIDTKVQTCAVNHRKYAEITFS